MKRLNLALLAFISFGVISSDFTTNSSYPDSIELGSHFPLNISHNVNNKQVGGNPQTGVSYGAWSSWETSSHMTNCTPWTPHTDTVNWGEPMIQTNLCDAEETRHREVTYTYANGVTHTETEYQIAVTKVDDEQDAVGTKNYILRYSDEYTTWIDVRSLHSCSGWTPDPSTVSQGQSFTQSNACKQDQERTKSTYEHWADGSKKLASKTTETRTVSETQYRSATGTKPLAKWKTFYSGSTTGSVSFNLGNATQVKWTVEYYSKGVKTSNSSYSVPKTVSHTYSSYDEDTYDCGTNGEQNRKCTSKASTSGSMSLSGTSLNFRGGHDKDRYAEAFVRLRKVEVYTTD